MTVPTFVVAGAPRCGTTSLHYYLRQHPQVCMTTIKEPNYFLFDADGVPFIEEPPIIRKSVRKLSEYRALFRPEPGAVAFGDVSPLYLYVEPTPARLRDVCGGNLKVACILRRPADRAWSHFIYAFPDVAPDRRTAEFASLVEAEIAHGPAYTPYRTKTHLLRLGRYAEQVRRYHETFGADNVLVLLAEDLAADRPAAFAALCRHIGIDADAPVDLDQRYNAAAAPRGGRPSLSRRLQRRVQPWVKAILPPRIAGRLAAARAVRSSGAAPPAPPLDDEVAARIAGWCTADVDDLARLIDRDLSDWHARPAG